MEWEGSGNRGRGMKEMRGTRGNRGLGNGGKVETEH